MSVPHTARRCLTSTVSVPTSLRRTSACSATVSTFVFASEGNFNFYAGPGAQIGFYGSKDDDDNSVTKMGLGVVGQIGMEYNFSLPLSLSLDWRPGISLTGGGFGWQGFALGIRYRF